MNFRILLLLFVLPLTFNGLAQSSLWKHYGAKQGLSETTINAFAQDKNEILWLGGQTGLEYFDGKRFKKVKSSATSEPYITSLLVDKNNNIWAGTRDGIWCYNVTTKKFQKKHQIVKVYSQIYKLRWNSDSTEMLVASSWGAYKIKNGGGPKRINPTIKGVVFDIYQLGNEYIASHNFQLIRFNEKNVSVLHQATDRIHLTWYSPTKSWLFVTSAGMYKTTPDLKKIYKLNIQVPWESKYYSDVLYVDSFNKIWINKYDTIYQFNNLNDRHPKKHFWNNANPYSISKSFCLFMDKDHNLWNSQIGSGICVLHDRAKGIDFTSFSELNTSYVWTLFKDKKEIVYGTAEGIRIQQIKRPWESQLLPNPVATKFGISNIQSFSKDFWIISTYNSGAWLLNKKTFKYIHFTPELSNSETNGIAKMKNKAVLVFTNDGIHVKRSPKEKLKLIPGFRDANALAWFKKNDNTVIVAVARGFLILNENGNTLRRTRLLDLKNRQMINSACLSINEKDENNLLVGSLNDGLFQMNWNAKTLEKIQLINNPASIYSIIKLRQEEWLITTNQGIYFYSSKTGISKQVNTRNYLNFNDFNQFGFHVSKDTIYLCGAGGVVSGTTEAFRSLFFEEATIQIFSDDIPTNEITLPAGSRFLELNAGLLMKSTRHTPFLRYRMDGLETNWKTVTSSNNIRYDFLPPEDYILHIQLSDPTNILTNQSLKIPIHVLPLWWESLWFKIMVYLLSIALIGFIFNYLYKLRLNWKLKQIAMEQQVNQERMRISRELHDNIGTQLSYLITGLETSESMVVESANTGLGEKLNRLQDTARISMQQLRDAVWVLNKEEISGTVLFQRFKEWALKMGDNYPIHMQLAHELPEELLIDSSQTLPIFRILQEAVHNTLKHAEASQLNVHFFFQDKALHIHLKDNGRGYTTTRKDGNGLINMNVRATEIGAKLTIHSEIDKGTELVLIVPIK